MSVDVSENRSKAIEGREDISQFIVHLTRSDPQSGKTARENFLSILFSHEVQARRPHCLYNERIKTLDPKVKDSFNVACFTEVPLNQLHRLVRDIPGRQVKLEAYGFVFRKDFIVASGGQPAVYINSYGNNQWLRESVDQLFEMACPAGALQPPLWRLLPFINAMHERYDFTWEREWRVMQKLTFKGSDLVCAILPTEAEDDLKEKFAGVGVAVISPGWSYEQIVAELARQQRETRNLADIATASTSKPAAGQTPSTP